MAEYIERQAAIDALRDAENHAFNSYHQGLIKAHKIITGLPPAHPERKNGKWIEEDQYIDKWDDTIEVLRCPICEFKHCYTQGDTSHSNDGWFNYCPNCGADMRGEQDDR